MAITVVKKLPNGSAILSNGNVRSPEARVSFPSLFKPTKPKNAPPTQEPKYSVTLLFKKGEDLSLLKEAVAAVLTEKFGPKEQGKWPKNLRLPFRDQGEREFEGYEAGAVFINCNSSRKPGVVNSRAEYIEDEGEVYPGCYGQATLRAFWYETSGNRGVSLGLQNFQKTRDGDSLGGRSRAEDEFDQVAGDPMGDGTSATANADPLADMV